MTDDLLRAFADSIGKSTGKGAELADAIYRRLLEQQARAAVSFLVSFGEEAPQTVRDCCG